MRRPVDNNRWWYKTKDRLEQILDDLWLGFLLVMCGLLVIGMCAVVLTACYVAVRLLWRLL